jgi:hypothetical protein
VSAAGWLAAVTARPDEVAAARPGDEIVPRPDVVMDRAFTVDATPEAVWPWLAQLGKRRAGWYLPRAAERFLPPSRRAARRITPAWQHPQPGDVIPDYGGRQATFDVAIAAEPHALVYRSRRGRTSLSWAITLTAIPPPAVGGGGADGADGGGGADGADGGGAGSGDSGAAGGVGSRVHLRLRLGNVRRRRLARAGGGLIDLLTIAGLAAGLRERVAAAKSGE